MADGLVSFPVEPLATCVPHVSTCSSTPLTLRIYAQQVALLLVNRESNAAGDLDKETAGT